MHLDITCKCSRPLQPSPAHGGTSPHPACTLTALGSQSCWPAAFQLRGAWQVLRGPCTYDILQLQQRLVAGEPTIWVASCRRHQSLRSPVQLARWAAGTAVSAANLEASVVSEVPICSDLQGVTYSGTPGRPLFIQRHTTPISQSSHWGELCQGRCCSRLEWCHHLVQPVTATSSRHACGSRHQSQAGCRPKCALECSSLIPANTSVSQSEPTCSSPLE